MNIPPHPSAAASLRRLNACAATRRFAPLALLIAGALVFSGSNAFAATEYFDTSAATGLTPGTATWDNGVTAAWVTSTSPGTAAPIIWTNGNDASFQTGGTNIVTVDGAVIFGNLNQASSTITTIGNTAGSTLQLNTSITNNSGTLASVLTVNAPVILNAASTGTAGGRPVVNGTTSPVVVNGVISETATAQQTIRIFTGNGTAGATSTTTLGGTNTFSGGIQIYASGTVQGASLIVTNVGAFGTSPNFLFGQGGAIGNTTLTANLAADGTISKNIIFTGAGTSTTTTGSSTINSSGTGAVTFTGNMLFNAQVGTATTGAVSGLFGSAGNLLVTLGGTSTANNTFQTNIINSSTTNLTFNTTSVTKADAGKWILTGTNTYGGATNINAGTLLINGNSGGATGNVTVASGATLGGTGTVGGATTVTGILSVGVNYGTGATPATLTFSNAATALTLGGSTLMDINGTAGKGVAGGNDLVNVSAGALVYGGTLNVSLNGFTPSNGSTYDLFDFTSQSGTFSAITVSGFNGTLDYTTGILTITAVPEPSTWVGAVCLSLLGLAIYRRRRAA